MNKINKIMSEFFNEELAQAGFDISDISDPKKWIKFLDFINAEHEPSVGQNKSGSSKHYIWKGNGVTVYTQNNPITGKHANGTDYREDEVGHIGYVGIDGNEGKVKLVFDYLKNTINYKEANPKKRAFL